MKNFLLFAFAVAGLLMLDARVDELAQRPQVIRVAYIPSTVSAVAEQGAIEAVPLLGEAIDRGTLTEQGRFFGRRPDPQNPAQPLIPDEAPPFEFPGGEIEIETRPDGTTVDVNAQEAGLKDWEPEDWAAFFEKLIAFISTISGLFAGMKARRAGGFGSLLKKQL